MKKINLPSDVQIINGPSGPRFRGPALSIRKLAESLRDLSHAPSGFVCRVGSINLHVTENRCDSAGKGHIALPGDAWGILASKFIEVTAGWEESPFDFGDCGYLHPKPDIDLGVELIGEPERE